MALRKLPREKVKPIMFCLFAVVFLIMDLKFTFDAIVASGNVMVVLILLALAIFFGILGWRGLKR